MKSNFEKNKQITIDPGVRTFFTGLTENKVVLKDSIISNYVKKEDIYKQVIANQEQKFDLQGQWVNELRKQNKTLKTKLIFTRIISVAFIALITYINLH
jgi:2-hydroxy-3-keto-5-methylthiopentenyl-1-phosphate phosphatase